MYGKIFTSIYTGTLGTKGPWEALVTFQQMIVLCDEEGVLDMTPEVLSRTTTIPLAIIRKGIAALEQADSGSRTPDEDGKRIVRLSPDREWGWYIVNYLAYRKIRSAEERREYMRNYQRKRRSTAVNHPSTPVNKVKDVNQSSKQYVEAEAETTTTAAAHIPVVYRETVLPYLTTARNLQALAADLAMLTSGGGEKVESWETVGHALHDMAVCSAPLTPKNIRAFCRKLSEAPANRGGGERKGPLDFDLEKVKRQMREEDAHANHA